MFLSYFLNLDPLFGVPLFLLSNADAQKNRDIQKRTAMKMRMWSWSLEKPVP